MTQDVNPMLVYRLYSRTVRPRRDDVIPEESPLRKTQRSSVSRELRNIRKSFVSIARSFEKLAPALAAAATGSPGERNGRAPSGRKRPKLSAAQMKALKLQGQYMGTMRGLSARNQAKVKAVRKSKGISAAIAEARRLAR